MAVINSPWVGDARGRLGAGVYLRSKGQTVARSYNPSPLNRRTNSQQEQRSVFSSAVRFYSRGVQNLFNFAFEDKSAKESDYNAFMRYNAKRGMYFGPAQNASDIYPSIGNYAMSRGSLIGPTVLISDGGRTMAQIPLTGYSSATFATIGDLSQALVDAGYQQGDIFTTVVIVTSWEAGNEGEPVVAGSRAPEWTIRQFVVDVASQVLLSTTPFSATASSTYLLITMSDAEMLPEIVCGHAWVVSRVTRGQVFVSSSDLVLNGAAESALYYGRSDTWLSIVLEAWDSEAPSILQGSRAVNDTRVRLGVTLSFNLPIEWQALSTETSYITTTDPVDAYRLRSAIAFVYSPSATGSELVCHWRVLADNRIELLTPDNLRLGVWQREVDNYLVWRLSEDTATSGFLRRLIVLG